jgi:hypothetical protein
MDLSMGIRAIAGVLFVAVLAILVLRRKKRAA